MRKFRSLVSVGLATTASLSLGACETLGIGTSKDVPANAPAVLRNVPVVENSPKSPCWQQRQIAKQRAYIDSVVSGKAVKYHADCAEPKPEPKTS